MIRLSIRRPVAVAMTYFAVALLGAFAWRNIPIENLPNQQLPRLSITAQWRGASPETVEAFLTSPLEATVQQVRGVEKIESESYEQNGVGQARISVEFNRDTDMDFARLDLSERVSQLEEDLPDEVQAITVEQYVPRELQQQGNFEYVLAYRMAGPYQLEALRRHIDDIVQPAIEQIDGVSQVYVQGGRERQIRIELDEAQMQALRLTPAQVSARIQDLEIVREAGTIRSDEGERTLTIRDRVTDVSELQDAILTTQGDKIVRVRDVARVSDTYEEARQLTRINGNPTVTFVIYKEDGANTVAMAEAVKAEVANLQRFNPYGSEIIEFADRSEDIKKQLVELRSRAGIGGLVIFLVLIAFLRSFKSGMVIFATIVFSVLISLNLIYFGGLTLNLLTLMGLAMGFGLIVDNSIVVLENVYRRWQAGEDPEVAAEEGARDVVLPILAATATTLIVFVPFVYLQGELRVFYVPLAIVVGLTLIASLFVAFTFIPSLSAKLLRRELRRSEKTKFNGPDGRRRAPFYERFYRGLVGFTLRHPVFAISVAVVCFGSSFYLFDKYVNRGVLWGGRSAQNESFVQVSITLPRGASIDRTNSLTQFFEERIAQMPEVKQYVSEIGPQRASVRMTFPDELNFTQVPVAIKEQLVGFSLQFTGATVRVFGDGPAFGYGGGGSAPNYSIQVLGYNYETVRAIAENLGTRLERMSRIEDVDTNSSSRGFTRDKASEFVVEIDREALARYDMGVDFLGNQLRSAIGGATRDGVIKVEGEDLAFQVKLAGSDFSDVLELTQTIVRTPAGTAIRLGDVVDVYERDVLARIRRENQQYERTVAYEFLGPTKLGDLIRDQVLATTEVPDGYTVKAADRWRWSTEERTQIYLVLSLSMILIYMVTAALFESVLQPLAVLLTVPMALIGVFLIFFYADASFTREAYIGVIMMGGIVVNNAILLVDHVNKVRLRPGLSFEEGIITGTVERVRPILMTTATTVLGLLPLVLFSQTADANIWNALGFALIGGLLSSTFFVLTLTPALYMLFERKKARRSALHGAILGTS
jgi:hydrophobic/amphiphilic exporter-1 (mainly G- bacteria), HAE1 family